MGQTKTSKSPHSAQTTLTFQNIPLPTHSHLPIINFHETLTNQNISAPTLIQPHLSIKISKSYTFPHLEVTLPDHKGYLLNFTHPKYLADFHSICQNLNSNFFIFIFLHNFFEIRLAQGLKICFSFSIRLFFQGH